MAKGNAAGGMGSMMGGVGQGIGAAAGSMGGGGGGIGQGSSMGAYSKGMSPFAQQKSMYSQMQPQMQQNKQMPQMDQNNPFSQNNPFIGMSRSHAMNTGQQGGYDNFQKMMEPGFWDQMKQQMYGNRGGSGMLPPQGGNQQILPPSQVQNYGNDMRAQYDQPMRAEGPGLQGMPDWSGMAQMQQQPQQAQLPSYGGGYGGGIRAQGGGGIMGPGGQQYGGGSIMNFLNPQRQGQVRF